MNKKIIKRIYNVVIILCFIGAIGWCFSHFYHGSDVVYTDDAQVNRHITPINTRVSGFIKEIRFSDYQHVKKGDTLVIIEDSEFRLHVAQAEAGLRGSKAGSSVVSASMGTTTTNVQTASAGIEEARVDMMNAKQDFDRFAALMKKDAVTRQISGRTGSFEKLWKATTKSSGFLSAKPFIPASNIYSKVHPATTE
jgi:membrane fusion protein (multidrug efflux system)